MTRYQVDETFRFRKDMWSRVGRLKRQLRRLKGREMLWKRELYSLLQELRVTRPQKVRDAKTGRFTRSLS